MIINGTALLLAAPIKNMLTGKERGPLTSYGLSEAGYDIRLKQDVTFDDFTVTVDGVTKTGRFTLASAIEEFKMPRTLIGKVFNKSTLARRGLHVFQTLIEPGWDGFLTLEMTYHGDSPLHIPAGTGIAQVLFEKLAIPAQYQGKYQNQADEPVGAING
jgi:dCTP deaminase